MEDLASGTVLGDRYELHDVVGSGGMATVWRATDRVLDRQVAVKVLHARLAEDPALLDRFRTEATASARLTHPNIVHVFDTGSDGPTAYIVMELCEGETLGERLARTGPLPPDEAAAIMVQVLSALEFAHEHDLVHRDVKPANVLLLPEGRVLVTDFGIAKAAYQGTDPTTTGRVLGSVPYLAPEQVEGRAVDPRADVYAAGAMLYQLLTGRVPFEAPTDIAAAMLRLTRDPAPPRSIRPGIPRSIEAVVQRAMARDPADRFASAADMAAALSRLTAPPPREDAVVDRAPAPRGGFFRSWMAVPLLAILVAAVVIVVGLLTQRLQLGGPFGIEQKPTTPASQAAGLVPVRVVQAVAYDPPPGDGHEHDSDLGSAIDGDPSTVWTTEGYHSPTFDKPGVGIAFDLGSPRRVGGFRLLTPADVTGWRFEIHVGDDLSGLQDASPPAYSGVATPDLRKSFRPVTGRYVLVWITRAVPAPDGENRAEVAEFTVLGPPG